MSCLDRDMFGLRLRKLRLTLISLARYLSSVGRACWLQLRCCTSLALSILLVSCSCSCISIQFLESSKWAHISCLEFSAIEDLFQYSTTRGRRFGHVLQSIASTLFSKDSENDWTKMSANLFTADDYALGSKTFPNARYENLEVKRLSALPRLTHNSCLIVSPLTMTQSLTRAFWATTFRFGLLFNGTSGSIGYQQSAHSGVFD
jgi:hypothetical protein